jgi:hypothetical protein
MIPEDGEGEEGVTGSPEPPLGYASRMAKEQVRAVLERVLSWPPGRQADVVQVIESMEEQDRSRLRLSDEQVAEVERRLADPNPRFLTLDEVREHFARKRV